MRLRYKYACFSVAIYVPSECDIPLITTVVIIAQRSNLRARGHPAILHVARFDAHTNENSEQI